jgi:arabinose-5-phosphate isomerase
VKPETLISKTALDTIRIEVETLQALSASINKEFCDCVQTIFQSRGRVIVTGIGKSALVGQKITATLNSTGTPSAFMHAADAIHGDLGMVAPDDLVLCLSKSGETPEIKALVPLVKNLGNRLIAVVGNHTSFLARQADFRLLTPVDKEADPNNLAPTASTTAQMAIGDALATSLLALRGFTPNDFAQFHPGGSLGKQLYLRVQDLYPQNERPAVHLDDNLPRVIMEMTSKRLGATAVVDPEEKLLGIITDGDLRRMLEKGVDFQTLTAKDVMTPRPKTMPPEAMAVDAFRLMRKYSITQIVVARENRYLGFVHLHDLIREGMI